ncbi:MAG TPA: pyridoxamine 5'-phosphate oxidase family protein [Pyrinomonadaceae bacterium]|nr:pyridoxamine 5'-phosphate oxidase family protein [Pyrinomonadaceae bacterium]
MNNEAALKLFTTAKVARLGCIVNGEPYVVPITCLLQDNYLYSHSLHGLKIAALRENPSACVQVDEIDSALSWRSAIAFGKYEEITNPDERSEFLNKLFKMFPMLTPVESTIAIDGLAQAVIVFRIRIDRLTAVSEE